MANFPKSKEQLIRELHLSIEEYEAFIFSSHFDAIAQVHLHVVAQICLQTGKMHIATFGKSVEQSLTFLQPFEIIQKPLLVDETLHICAKSLEEHLSIRTALVSIELLDDHEFVLQDLERIAKSCQEKGIFFHVDITNALSFIDQIEGLHLVDFITFGFEGRGVVLAKDQEAFVPMRMETDQFPFTKWCQTRQNVNSTYMQLAAIKDGLMQQFSLKHWSVAPIESLPSVFLLQSATIHSHLIKALLQKKGYQIQVLQTTASYHHLPYSLLYGCIGIKITPNLSLSQLQTDLQDISQNCSKLTAGLLTKEKALI